MWVKWLGQSAKPQPGQAFLIEPGQTQALSDVCLPVQIRGESLLFEPPAGKIWLPGEQLEFWGPLGKPFDPPPGCRKWLLLAPEGHLGRLLPLVEQGLDQGISLAAWASQPLPSLPPAVELLTGIPEGLAWADYIAVDLGELDRSQSQALNAEDLDHARAKKIEALITPPMPCGFGGCGVCAVKARRGWNLACVDGPVFDWKSLGR